MRDANATRLTRVTSNHELRIEIPALRDENDGYPVIAVVTADGIRYRSEDRDIGEELGWDSAVAWELARQLNGVRRDLRATAEELLDIIVHPV